MSVFSHSKLLWVLQILMLWSDDMVASFVPSGEKRHLIRYVAWAWGEGGMSGVCAMRRVARAPRARAWSFCRGSNFPIRSSPPPRPNRHRKQVPWSFAAASIEPSRATLSERIGFVPSGPSSFEHEF